jgi:hypothetical protein
VKFATRQRYSYKVNGIDTDVDYVTMSDIESKHGSRFAEQFKKFALNLKKLHIKEKEIEAYYYADYQHIARRTELFLNPVS